MLNLKRPAANTGAEPEIEVEESGRGLLIIDENGEALPAVRHKRSNVVSIKGRKPGAMDAAAELGERLRRSREARGMSVDDIAEVLKFRADYVEALEAGEIKELPVTYAIGFLRSYAEFLGGSALGIDIPAAVAQVKQAYDDPHHRGDMWSVSRENAMPKLSLLLVAALMALGICVAWKLSQDPSHKAVQSATTYQGQLSAITQER